MGVWKRMVLLSCSVQLIAAGVASAQSTKLDWALTTTGKMRQVITNMGTFDKGRTNYPGLINAEFPAGSDEEHLFQGGIWVGGITPTGDTLVSQSEAHFTPHEFYPSASEWDTIYTGSKGDTLNIPYWPLYECISDQDFVCRYSDYNLLNVDNHTPLYLDVVQTTYSWSSAGLDAFLLYKYYIVPKKIPVKDMYIGFWMHSAIGNVGAGDNYIDEFTRYFPDYRMAMAEDSRGGNDGQAISPVGFSVLAPTTTVSTWSFNYYEHEELPGNDQECYSSMASGNIMPDRLERARAHIIYAFGPFQAKVGDTIVVEMAEILVSGFPGRWTMPNICSSSRARISGFPRHPPSPYFA